MTSLHAKIALVTGAASGIGKATALRLAEKGASLILVDVNEAELAEVAKQVQSMTNCLLAEKVDVSNRDAMKQFADKVHQITPAVDILVNNAGVGLSGGVLNTSLDDWAWVLGINLWGVIHGCHYFIPAMVKRGQGGHVVNVSSVLGYFGAPNVLGYSTSKFAVLGLSESLRAELAHHKIAVSTICPGIIKTGIIQKSRFAGAKDENQMRDKVDSLYRRRNYGPEKVADAIVSAIEKEREVIPVSPEAWALYFVKRFVPGMAGAIGRVITKNAMGE